MFRTRSGIEHEGLAIFAASPAIFHLFTHAFFKALLCLAAGSVMHAMGNTIDMRNSAACGRSCRSRTDICAGRRPWPG